MTTSRIRFSKSRRTAVLAAVVCGVAASALAESASAAVFTFNKTAAGTYLWSTAGNWNPAGGPPNAAGDTASVTSATTVDTVILSIDAPETVGILTIGIGSHIFTVTNGGVATNTLTFNNGASPALLSVPNVPAGSTGNVLTADVLLAGDLSVTSYGADQLATTLNMNGTIKSSAASGVQTLTISSTGVTYHTTNHLLNINSAISDGVSGGTIALAQKIGSGTGDGITTLSGANTYSGGTLVVMGTLKGTQNSGTPFGTGNITSQGGHLMLAPSGSGSAVSVAGANATPTTTFNYGGGGFVDLRLGSETGLTFTVGNVSAAANSVLARQNSGTLIITPTAIANLGSTERFIVNGDVLQSNSLDATKKIVSPTIVAQASSASPVADFLIHDTTNGFQPATALYTARTGAVGALVTGEISNVTGAATTASGNPYALRLGAALTIATNGTLTVGSGSGQAGVIINANGTIPAGTNTTLEFNGAEAAIYMGADATIAAKVDGTAGLTKFGPNKLTLGNAANSFSGGIRVNNGILAASNVGSLGASSNSITLMPQTQFDITALSGLTIPQNIILNGGRTTTTGNYNTDEAQISSVGTTSATAPILSGIISTGTNAQTSNTAAGLTIRNGYTRISNNSNSYTGTLRLWSAVVIADANNAFGFGDGTQGNGVATYVTSSVGVRGGVTVSNEYLEITAAGPSGIGTLHAFSGGSGNVGEWAGPVVIGTGSNFGADANTTLKLSGTLVGTGQGVRKVGPGIVEVSVPNTISSVTGVNAVSTINAGTLRVTNATGSALGGSPVEALSGATFDGNGFINGSVMIRSGGFLKPGTSIGTLTIQGGGVVAGTTWANNTGSVTTEANSHLVMEMNSTAADKLALTAANVGTIATLGAPIEFAVDPTFAPAVPTTFDLITARTISYAGLVGPGTIDVPLSADNLDEQLAAINPSYTRVSGTPVNPYEYSYTLISNDTANTDILRVQFAAVSAVPEPASVLLLGLGAAGLLARRRRA